MSQDKLNTLESNPTGETKETIAHVHSNWNLIGGTNINNAVKTIISHEDTCIHPQLDEIISAERAILLARTNDEAESTAACRLKIRLLLPAYKIDSLSLVCSAQKIEIFVGAQAEYLETIYGKRLEEDGETKADETAPNYRYDVEIEKSGVLEIALKFLTTADELCLYGALLYLIPNPNGITTSLTPQIDMQNVQQMLSDSKMAPDAQKLKTFLDIYAKISENNVPITAANATANIYNASNLSEDLKRYIDYRLNMFEERILLQLRIFEENQTKKLDKILNLMEKKLD